MPITCPVPGSLVLGELRVLPQDLSVGGRWDWVVRSLHPELASQLGDESWGLQGVVGPS